MAKCCSRVLAFAAVILAAGMHVPNPAFAQNAPNYMRMFGGVIQQAARQAAQNEWQGLPPNEASCLDEALRRQGYSVGVMIQNGITPNDPRLSGPRVGCKASTIVSNVDILNLSSKPTFDCTKARSLTARTVCLDQAGAAADWDLISAYWARYFSLDQSDRQAFDQAQQTWLDALNQICVGTQNQRQCVLSAYHKRAADYRSQLGGDALAESRLSPQQHAQIQRSLIALGFFGDKPDGEFGPNTRLAIKRFKTQSGNLEGGDFLTAEQQEKLIRGGPSPEAAASASSRPAQSTSEASVPTAAPQTFQESLSPPLSPPPSPEEAFANILLDYGWSQIFGKATSQGDRCARYGMNPLAGNECVKNEGYKLGIFAPADCELTIQEQYPLGAVSRTWDGQIQGSYVIGQSLTFPFSGFAPDRFYGQLVIVFEFPDRQFPIKKVLTTGSNGTWVELPPQPIKADISGLSLTQRGRDEAYQKLLFQWNQKINEIGRRSVQPPAGSAVGGLVDTITLAVNAEDGKSMMSIAVRQSPPLVEALKRLIAKCKIAVSSGPTTIKDPAKVIKDQSNRYSASQLQDCYASNPYYPGCPIDNQYCPEQGRYVNFNRACAQKYGNGMW